MWDTWGEANPEAVWWGRHIQARERWKRMNCRCAVLTSCLLKIIIPNRNELRFGIMMKVALSSEIWFLMISSFLIIPNRNEFAMSNEEIMRNQMNQPCWWQRVLSLFGQIFGWLLASINHRFVLLDVVRVLFEKGSEAQLSWAERRTEPNSVQRRSEHKFWPILGPLGKYAISCVKCI